MFRADSFATRSLFAHESAPYSLLRSQRAPGSSSRTELLPDRRRVSHWDGGREPIMQRVRGICAKRDAGDRTLQSRSMLPRDLRSIVFRAIVNHQHLVTRTKRVQGAAEAERIIVRVQQGGDFRHLATLKRFQSGCALGSAGLQARVKTARAIPSFSR